MGNFFSCAKKPPEKPAIAAAPPATTDSPTPPSPDQRSKADGNDWSIDDAALDELEKELGPPQPDSP